MTDDCTDLIAGVYESARRWPERPAITAPGRRTRLRKAPAPGRTISYAALVEGIESTARALRAEGFGLGERMLFSVRPGPDAFVLALGAVRAGGSIVFIDPGIGPALFKDRADLAAPRWAAAESLLYALSAKGPLRPIARRRGLLLPDYAAMNVRHFYSGPWLPGVPRGARPVKSLAGAGAGANMSAGISAGAVKLPGSAPEQEAVTIFTSGTTGHPKGVVHTRGSLAAGFGQLMQRCTFDAGDRIHSEQLMMGLPALIAGAHWTMPAYGLSAHIDPLRLAAELGPVSGKYDGATHLFLVPAQLAPILDAVEAGAVTLPETLRTVMLGAAPVLAPFLERAMRVLPGVGFKLIYGMTELLPIAIADGAEKLAFASGAEAELKAPDGTGEGDLLGAPLPAVRIRVAEDHELLASGPNMCRGYLGQPDMSEHATGDLVRLDRGGPDGRPRLVMIGRKKDMIIRGKTNIYPALYEPLIANVRGVAQAAMVGVPDGCGDEAVWLAIVPASGEEPAKVKARLARELPRLIDGSALPDRIETMQELPVGGRHRKTDRAKLREDFAAAAAAAVAGSGRVATAEQAGDRA